MSQDDFSKLSLRKQRKLWSKTESDIRDLATQLGDSISDRDRSVVLDYLDHNELGIALEHLCDALIEYDQRLSPELHDVTKELFHRMEIDPGRRLQDLSPEAAG